MNAADVTLALDQALPDSKIVSDLRAALEEGSKEGFTSIELMTVWTLIPIDASLQIVKKEFTKDDTRSSTNVNYRVTVAIGEFQSMTTGSHKAGYCFVELVYDDEGGLVTYDFRRDYIQ